MTPRIIGGTVAAAVAIVGSAALAFGLSRRRRRAVIPADAPGLAEQTLPGFIALGAAVGTDERAALVAGEGGRVAVLKARGRRIVVREVSWLAVRSTPAGMIVDTGTRRLGQVMVIGVSALDVRRITAQHTP